MSVTVDYRTWAGLATVFGHCFRGAALGEAVSVQKSTRNGRRSAYSGLVMGTWMKSPGSRPFGVPAEYLPLHKYLDGRYADTVVLTLAEIEDLLGVTLPDLAHVQQEWWANGDADSTPSPQSCAWTRANRTAKPNLPAQIVAFERTSA